MSHSVDPELWPSIKGVVSAYSDVLARAAEVAEAVEDPIERRDFDAEVDKLGNKVRSLLCDVGTTLEQAEAEMLEEYLC